MNIVADFLKQTSLRFPDKIALVDGDVSFTYARLHAAANRVAAGMASLAGATLERWFTAPYRAAHPEVMEKLRATIAATPVDGYAGCGRAIATIDYTSQLTRLTLPALVIVGEQDLATPVAMAREIADALPGATLAVLPSAAHLSNIEQAELFNRTLLDFLQQTDCASR